MNVNVWVVADISANGRVARCGPLVGRLDVELDFSLAAFESSLVRVTRGKRFRLVSKGNGSWMRRFRTANSEGQRDSQALV